MFGDRGCLLFGSRVFCLLLVVSWQCGVASCLFLLLVVRLACVVGCLVLMVSLCVVDSCMVFIVCCLSNFVC